MGRYNHQPFENWLLSEEPLTPEEQSHLQDHLQDCEACQQVEAAWSGVQQVFTASSRVAPAPGFAARWQLRLEEERREAHERQTWFILAFTAGSASFMFFLLGLQALQMLRSPTQISLFILYRLIDLVTLARATGDLAFTFIRTIPGLLPLPVWILSAGLLSILSVLWIVFYQSLTSRRIQA